MSNRAPLSISVVIPVYLRRASASSLRLLRTALESAFDQTWPGDAEIIVVDDGSPESVRKAVEGIAGAASTPQLRYLRTQRNYGVSHALNLGIRRARYDYIARLDADDRWLPGKIDAQRRALDADDDVTLVATGMSVVDDCGAVVERHVRKDGWANILALAFDTGWCPFPHGSVMARTLIYRLLGGYSHALPYAHCEDYRLWSHWIRFFKPAMVEQVLYEYRRTPGAVSAVHDRQQKAATMRISSEAARLDRARLPDNMQALSDVFGLGLLQCSVICYRMWRYCPSVAVPADAVGLLRRILSDRDLALDEAPPSNAPSFRELASGFAAPGLPSGPDTEVVLRVRA